MGKFDDLPGDIMSDILSRLPTESVLDCKFVSKPWKNLVCHPSFSQLHLNRLNAADSGRLGFIIFTNRKLHYTEYDEISDTFIRTARACFKLPDTVTSHYVLGSANGLVCFNTRADDWSYYQPGYISNPVTREYVMLSKLEGDIFTLCGFGYSPSANLYKVVRIYELSDENVQVAEVYTLGSGKGWRNVGKLDHPVRRSILPGVVANGAVHWLDTEQNVVSFDLADEKFSQFPSPHFSPGPCNCLSLGLMGDFLRATSVSNNYDSSIYSFEIWLLKKNKDDHGMTWIKQFNLVEYEPFAFTKSGGLLCYRGNKKDIYNYDPKASSSKLLLNCGYLMNSGAVFHKNTLVGLNALGEINTGILEYGERSSCTE